MSDESILTPQTTERRFVSAFRLERDAKELVAAAAAPIGNWQANVARLSQLINRKSTRGAERESARTRCDQLQQDVYRTRMRLRDGLNEAPEKVRNHGRVVDVLKALENLDALIEEVRRKD